MIYRLASGVLCGESRVYGAGRADEEQYVVPDFFWQTTTRQKKSTMMKLIFLICLFNCCFLSNGLSLASSIDFGNHDVCGSPLSPSLSFSGLKIQAEFFAKNSSRYYRTRITSCVNGEKLGDDLLSEPVVLESLDFKSSLDYLSWVTPICSSKLCYVLARRQELLNHSNFNKADDQFLGGIYQCRRTGSTGCDEFQPFAPLLRSFNRKPWTEMHRDKLVAVLPVAEGPILRQISGLDYWYELVNRHENYTRYKH